MLGKNDSVASIWLVDKQTEDIQISEIKDIRQLKIKNQFQNQEKRTAVLLNPKS